MPNTVAAAKAVSALVRPASRLPSHQRPTALSREQTISVAIGARCARPPPKARSTNISPAV